MKKLIAALVSVVVVLSAALPAYANEGKIDSLSTILPEIEHKVDVSLVKHKSQYERALVSGYIPYVRGLDDKAFQAEVNNTIDNIIRQALSKENRNIGALIDNGQMHRDLTMVMRTNYEVFRTGDIISIGMHFTGKYGDKQHKELADTAAIQHEYIAHSRETWEMDTEFSYYLVLDTVNETFVTLADIYGAGYQADISSMIEPYLQEFGFEEISADQTFYINEENHVVLVFNREELAEGSLPMELSIMDALEASQELDQEIQPEEQTAIIEGEDLQTITIEDEEVLMVPLNRVADPLGYVVRWNETSRMVEITKGGEFYTISVGQNFYTVNDSEPFQLESAPEIYDGRTHVPFSFFEKVMGLTQLELDGTDIIINLD